MNINGIDSDCDIYHNQKYDDLYSKVYMSWSTAYEEGNYYDRHELLQQMVTYVQTIPQKYNIFWYSLKTIAYNSVVDLCDIDISKIEGTIHEIYDRIHTLNDGSLPKLDIAQPNSNRDLDSLSTKLETIYETLGGDTIYYLDFDIIQKLQSK